MLEDLESDARYRQGIEHMLSNQPARVGAKPATPRVLLANHDTEQAALLMRVDVGDGSRTDQATAVAGVDRPGVTVLGEGQDDAGKIRNRLSSIEGFEIMPQQQRNVWIAIPSNERVAIRGSVLAEGSRVASPDHSAQHRRIGLLIGWVGWLRHRLIAMCRSTSNK